MDNRSQGKIGRLVSNSFIYHMPDMGKSFYAKKKRAKRLEVCPKCARWTCNRKCHFLGMMSKYREDKVDFIKDGLSKESLDDVLLILETYCSGDVYKHILCL